MCKQYNLNAFAAFIHFEDTSAFRKKKFNYEIVLFKWIHLFDESAYTIVVDFIFDKVFL